MHRTGHYTLHIKCMTVCVADFIALQMAPDGLMASIPFLVINIPKHMSTSISYLNVLWLYNYFYILLTYIDLTVVM